MSNRHRLQSRAQAKATPVPSHSHIPAMTVSSSTSASSIAGLKYQNPAHFPLQPKEKRQLDSLIASCNSENSQARRYLADAMRALGDAAGDLAEIVPAIDFAMKEEESGEESGAEGEGEEVKRAGKKLLVQMERRAREMVDRGWEAGVAVEVFRGAVVKVAEENTGGEEGEEEEEEVGLWEVFEGEMGKLSKERGRMSLKDRYATVAEYKDFRRSIWETQHDDPMPPTKHWFPPESHAHHQPPSGTAPTPSPASHPTPDPEDDSDLEIESARQSFNCPITLRPFTHPVTSTLCPHSFEKSAITPMLADALTYRAHGSDDKPPREGRDHPLLNAVVLTGRVNRGEVERCIQCPVAGCDKWLSVRHLREDRVLMRRIRREREKREREEVLRGMGEGEGGGGGGRKKEKAEESFIAVGEEESIVDTHAGQEGGNVKREKARLLDIDSEDD